MSNIIQIKRGLKTDLASSTYVEGELKYCTDTNELFIDFNGVHNKVGGSINVDDIYPINSIYLSFDSTSPASKFGGTWEQLDANKVLRIGQNTQQGGSDNYNLTYNNIWTNEPLAKFQISGGCKVATSDQPRVDSSSNRGNLTYLNTNSGSMFCGSSGGETWASSTSRREIEIINKGAQTPISTLPAYQNIYAWRRTA